MLNFKPSVESLESLIERFYNVSMGISKHASALSVLESPLLNIATELCQRIEDGELEDLPKENIYDLLRYYNLCNTIQTAEKLLESGLTDLYRRANHITQRMSTEDPISFEKKLKSKLSKREIGLLNSFQESMCSDIGEIAPSILDTCVSEMVEYSYSIYYMYHHFLFCMLVRIDAHVNIPKVDELQEMLVSSYKQYAIDCKDRVFDRLEEEAAKLKEYKHKKLSPEEWGKLYEQEQDAIEKIITYEPGMKVEEVSSYYNADNIFYYSNFYEVIDLFTKGRKNERLFSFKKLFDNKWEIFSKFIKEEEAIDVFFEFILRYDIIMCNMFPELKSDFEEYLKIERITDDALNSSCISIVQSNGAKPIPFVIRSDQSDEVIAYIKELMVSKTNPKDIIKPLRAAQDAGVIRRPTWDEFQRAFPDSGVRSKSSLTTYTKADAKPYENDKSFEEMVEDFKKRFLSD